VLRFKFSTWTSRASYTRFQVPCFAQNARQGDIINHNGPVPRGATGPTCSDDGRVLNRFVRALKGVNAATMPSPMQKVKMAMVEVVCEDLSHVLDNMSRTLDNIELSLHDGVPQETRPRWREQLGRWQNTLMHQSTSLERMLSNLSGSRNTDSEGPRLEKRLARLVTEVEWMDRRARTALKSPMPNVVIAESIVESACVVKEANSSGTLTQLAFLFIPLVLEAMVFGTCINVRISLPLALSAEIGTDKEHSISKASLRGGTVSSSRSVPAQSHIVPCIRQSFRLHSLSFRPPS